MTQTEKSGHLAWCSLVALALASKLGLSGRARELPPCAPTEPDVTVSRHPALVVDC
ncbi:TPA: hypothetical protein ONC18_002260 [Enterobacter kobei]|nr:hypothetical protein [Enterobacter kobei]